ncbi:MAG: DUF2071 domain-containing protein [Acidimicrobiales bacterium]
MTVAPEPVTATTPRPVRRPVMLQSWTDLVYLHWDHPPDVVQALLPDGVRVDTFEDRAWIGLVPFMMRAIRVPGTPAIPWVSTFPEINVRTYVIDATGRRAVWFFSLDIPRSVPVGIARLAYDLPYCWAAARYETDGERRRYVSRRRRPHRSAARLDMTILPTDPIAADRETDLDRWLTARWGLVAGTRRTLRHAPVDHPRWPLHRAEVLHLDQTLVEAAGLPAPASPPHVLYSPGVDVRVGLPRRIG